MTQMTTLPDTAPASRSVAPQGEQVTVLLVPADDTQSVKATMIATDRATVLGLVGDTNTESVFYFSDSGADGAMVCAAHGKRSTKHPVNVRATRIMERFLPGFAAHSRVYGDAFFVSLNDDPDSDVLYADVSEDVVAFAYRLFGR